MVSAVLRTLRSICVKRNRLLLFLVAAATSGCIVVTKDVEHKVFLGDEFSETRPFTGVKLEVTGTSQDRSVQVQAFVRQECTELWVHVYERTTSKRLKLRPWSGTTSNDWIYASM